MPRHKDPREPPLETYRQKRSADTTPEPIGVPVEASEDGEAFRRPRLFVVQKHAARRLHYDFRLEWEGVLLSWAVPMGPSTDTAVKRLAVHVEDHPIEYADFEGIIPKGNYGAGAVIAWDRGLWIPLENPADTYPRGKLSFELHGYKLHGHFHLFRTKDSDKEWLLIKKQDAWSGPEGARSLTPESIYSGLTLEELRDGHQRVAFVCGELERLKAPRAGVDPRKVQLMLAEAHDEPFSDPEWVFELKHDGFRVLASRVEGEPVLLYRRGSDSTKVFPEVARGLKYLPYDGLVLDGEVVVLDELGRPSFQRLQRRALLNRSTDIQRATVDLPVTYYAFDILGFEDYDLRPLPLVERKAILEKLMPRAGPIRYSEHFEGKGEALFAEVERMRLEGVIGKRADSAYRGGRSPQWRKIRADRTDDFVVVGYTKPQGGRTAFGALHVATYDGDVLVYAGRVGSGFSDGELVDALDRLTPLVRPEPACKGSPPRGAGHVWVEPRLVCEVRYKERTGEKLLRQPVFLRWRDDKSPEDCLKQDAALLAPRAELPAAVEDVAAERVVPFSNRDKIFWPDEGYTKGDLIDFYRRISPWMLPYLRDRLIVMTRYPDGIGGKNFFQKDVPGFVPGWVRTERMWSENAQREIDYFVADDEETLLYIINLGTIPLHIWSSRVATLQHPDWCILDLDPKGAPFAHVVEVARCIRSLCEDIGLPSFIKTSGATGLHVLLPMGRQITYEQSRSFGELLARLVSQELPEIATTTRIVGNRGGRVYVDFLQNGHGRLLAGVFSVRPRPGAMVSTPLEWAEVDETLDPDAFTIRTVPERMESLGRDPLLDVLELRPDLGRALQRIGERLTAE